MHVVSGTARCARDIRCPIFPVAGRTDRLTPRRHAGKLANAVAGSAGLPVVEDGNPVVNNKACTHRNRTADRMAARPKAAQAEVP